jgi:hypothetical protein
MYLSHFNILHHAIKGGVLSFPLWDVLEFCIDLSFDISVRCLSLAAAIESQQILFCLYVDIKLERPQTTHIRTT